MVFWVAFDDNHAVLGSVGHQTTGVGASGKGQVFSFIKHEFRNETFLAVKYVRLTSGFEPGTSWGLAAKPPTSSPSPEWIKSSTVKKSVNVSLF